MVDRLGRRLERLEARVGPVGRRRIALIADGDPVPADADTVIVLVGVKPGHGAADEELSRRA